MATEAEIGLAVQVLRRGGLVAVPTETVYGLAADALNPDAVRRIFELKGRPAGHPLIVHLPAPRLQSELAWRELLSRWATEVPQLAVDLAVAFWPGPLTMILRRAAHVPDDVTGGLPTVGLRVPGHPVAQALLTEFAATQPQGRAGLAAPSANRFGHISPTTAQHVQSEFGSALLLASDLERDADGLRPRVDGLILDGGAAEIGIESTIVDLSQGTPSILRHGATHLENLRQVMLKARGPDRSAANQTQPVRAPGTLPQHYSPRADLRLVEQQELTAGLEVQQIPTALIAPKGLVSADVDSSLQLLLLGDSLEEQAHGLYAALRAADDQAEIIYAVLPPAVGLGVAIRDRLYRAAGLGDALEQDAP